MPEASANHLFTTGLGLLVVLLVAWTVFDYFKWLDFGKSNRILRTSMPMTLRRVQAKVHHPILAILEVTLRTRHRNGICAWCIVSTFAMPPSFGKMKTSAHS